MEYGEKREEYVQALAGLDQLEKALEEVRADATKDASAVRLFLRIDKFSKYARSRFDSADADLLCKDNIINFANAFGNIQKDIKAYSKDKSIQKLESSNATIDRIVAEFSVFYPEITPKDMHANLQLIATSQESLRSLLDSYTNEVLSNIAKINTKSDEFSQLAGGTLKSITDSVQGQADEIGRLMVPIKEQIELIAKGTLSGHFGSAYNDEQGRADTWTRLVKYVLAFWFAINFIIFTYSGIDSLNLWGFILTFTHGDQSQGIVRQLLVTTPLLLFTGFAALKVSTHQRSARANRRTHVELLTITSYLANLPEPIKNDIMKSFAEKLFGQREEDGKRADSLPSLTLIADILKLGKSSGS